MVNFINFFRSSVPRGKIISCLNPPLPAVQFIHACRQVELQFRFPLRADKMVMQARNSLEDLQFLMEAACLEKADKHDDTLRVHLATPEHSFPLLSKKLFEGEVVNPLKSLLKKLPEWLTCHFGTWLVLVNENEFVNVAILCQGGNLEVQLYTKLNHRLPFFIRSSVPPAIAIEMEGDPCVGVLKPTHWQLPRSFVIKQGTVRWQIKADICKDHEEGVAFQESAIALPGIYEVVSDHLYKIYPRKVTHSTISLVDRYYGYVACLGLDEQDHYYEVKVPFIKREKRDNFLMTVYQPCPIGVSLSQLPTFVSSLSRK
ncbi:MAG: hypothetical protein A3E87_00490 [Gammaproteobacteria bacterium RIFCSPHIGHO2_12_FULL_35_23]|nr:MAG: hypothetical protein A3E87_00490 [Gammaproteobacteria bacterium RIFCSPHIGHO2_12_FULL_35_23]